MKDTKQVILRPLRAIRAKCLDCTGFSTTEVTECPSTSCTLHPYRFGIKPKECKMTSNIAPFLKQIKKG